MTPRERFLACLHQKPSNRPSVANAVSIATVHLMDATGCQFPRAREIVDAQGRGEAAPRRIGLIGNINNPATLLHGTPQDVADKVAECLAQEIEIIGPGCAVPLTTPTENLQAVAEAVRAQTSC